MYRELVAPSTNRDPGQFPPTYLVLKFAPNVKDVTILWLIERITGRKIDGGSELLVRRQPFNVKQGVVLHISASQMKFLQMAEDYELVKTDRSGVQREFLISQLEEFVTEGSRVEDLLTTAERQTLVRHELDNLRALPTDRTAPGYPTITFYEGKALLSTLLDCSLVAQLYPLHDDEILRKLGHKWFMSLTNQPMDDIKLYFGEAVALYFTFVGYYTTALLVPTILGIIQMFLSTETLTYYCVFNVLWVIVFLEMWKRKSNELAFNWGTIGMTSLDEPRANYRGKLGIDPITGKLQPQTPTWKTNLKVRYEGELGVCEPFVWIYVMDFMSHHFVISFVIWICREREMYCVSFPVVFLCLIGGFIMMLWSFWAEEQLKEHLEPDSWWIMTPSIVYTALVYVLNLFYRQFATFLTNWENHRTQSQYDRHRVIKMVLFEFVNNFLALFYIAFVLQDIDMLKQQLATMLIILQTINHFQEALLPLLLQLLNNKMSQWKHGGYKKLKDRDHLEDTSSIPLVSQVPCLRADDSRIEQADKEGALDDYQGTYDDYLELFIQFGYVVLFSSVYPLAAFFAVLNNILEIRADAFKLCRTCQRPAAYRVKNIGAWQRAFEIIGAMSIMTNCGLLWLSPKMRGLGQEVGLSDLEYAFSFVVLEHCLLGMRYVLHQAINERPEWVRIALARKNHIAKEALKKDRARKSFKLWRHWSVYGTNEAL